MNTMKHTLLSLLVCSLFWPACLLAQVATISEEMELRADDSYEIIGEIAGQLFVLRDMADGAKLYCFDSHLKISWENDIRCESRNFRVLGTVARPGYIGIALQYKKMGEHIVQFQKLDANGALVDTVIVKNYGKRAFSPETYFVRSHNHEKIAIFSDHSDHVFEAAAIDTKTMHKLWEKSVPLNLSYQNDLFEVTLSNRGDMYAIFYEDHSRARRERNSIHLLRLNDTEPRLQWVGFGANLFFDGHFYYDDVNEQVVGAGLFDERKAQRVNGYFFMRVPGGQMDDHQISFHHFPKEIITTVRGKESKPEDHFGEVYVKDLILKSDGGVVLVAERYKVVSQMYQGHFNPRMPLPAAQAEYHYDDIIVLNINPDGSLGWGDVLYKRQFSRNDKGYMSSFFIMKNPEEIRFLYHDEIKSRNNKVGQYAMDRKGKSKRRTILDTYGYKVNMMFSEGMQINKDEVIVPSLRRGDFKLVRIRYGIRQE